MRVLITGVSGYVGSVLAPRLAAEGHELRGLARDPARVRVPVPVVRGDVVSGAGLDQALEGIEVAYFLIHSMETVRPGGKPSGGDPSNGSGAAAFSARERRGAENFAGAARAAGVRRIVYLGGPVPADGQASPHLASRLAVEELLLGATPASVALRASIVIGARSRSLRFLVRMVERLPVMILPAWHVNRTQPVDERDMLEYLARCATSAAVDSQSLDIAGPDILTYGQMIEGIADAMLVSRPSLRLPISVTPVASRVAAAIAGEDPELIGPLMASLEGDLLARDDRAARLLGVRRHGFDRAVEHALRDWEALEPLAAR